MKIRRGKEFASFLPWFGEILKVRKLWMLLIGLLKVIHYTKILFHIENLFL